MPTSSGFASTTVSVPLISSGVRGSAFSPLAPWPQAPADAARFEFGQHWRAAPEPGFQPGEVRVGALNHELAIWADLAGSASDRVNDADDHHLWRRGDVFECFIQADAESAYHEYHVAPDGSTVHLAFPGEWDRDGEITPFVQRPTEIRARVMVQAERWLIFVLIPLPLGRGFESPLQGTWHLSFGRYDHRPDRDPIISSTSPHLLPDFHRRSEWGIIHLDTTA